MTGMPRLSFAAPLLAVVAALMFLGCKHLLRSEESWQSVLRENAPLLVFCLFNIAFVVIAYIHTGNGISLDNPNLLRWGFNFFLAQVAVLAAWYIGRKSAGMGNKALGYVLVFTLTVMLGMLVAEFLHLSGLANYIGILIAEINDISIRVHSLYIWHYPEPVRAQGLAQYPSFYAFSALAAFCWAISSKKMLFLRSSVVFLSVSICFLTGTRTAYLAFILAALVFAVILIRRKELIDWFRQHYLKIAVLLFALIVFLGGLSMLAESSNVLRNIPRAEASGAVSPVVGSTGLLEGPYEQLHTAEDDLSRLELSYLLNEISSGRGEVWSEAFGVIMDNPLGTWEASGIVLQNAHAHNELLNRWVTAGPLSVGLYLWFIFWLMFSARAVVAPRFPLMLAVALITFGLFEVVFDQAIFAPAAMYILGFVTAKSPPKELSM